MPSEHLEYGMSCLDHFKFVKRLDNLWNQQVQAFIIFYLIMSSFVISINKVANLALEQHQVD